MAGGSKIRLDSVASKIRIPQAREREEGARISKDPFEEKPVTAWKPAQVLKAQTAQENAEQAPFAQASYRR